MKNPTFTLRWITFLFVLIMFVACGRETPTTEQLPSEIAALPTLELTTEPTEMVPTATEAVTEPISEPTAEIVKVADAPKDALGFFGFEDGTTQGWRSREEKAIVSIADDLAYSGSYSIIVTDRTEDFEGATVDVMDLLEPGITYLIGGYVRLVEGEPNSRVIMTMQRTPTGGDTTYEWVAPSAENGVTDSDWVYLEGLYSFNGEVEELLLYFESPDEALVNFYIDDVSITLKPVETGAKVYDFEDGTQGWLPRGESFVSTSSDVVYDGNQSLVVSDRSADWHGATIDVKNLMEPDKIYDISGYVRLADGEPDSRVIITMQRTPSGGSTVYEWIAPSDQDGVADSEWVFLQGQYSFSGEVSELMLYVESPDEEFVDFYIDDISIVDLAAVPDPPIQTDIGSVYETLSPYFLVGAAIEPSQLDSERHVELLNLQFNSITAENVMKPGPIQPSEGEFRWAGADRLVQYAKDNNMAVHGHTLVWHQQAAEWMFEDSEGNPLEETPENKELVLARLEEHIRAVVGRYKDDVNVWDVVNEAIDATKPNCMRQSPWYELTGTDYIVTAFEVAHEVAPEAALIYNDYGTTDPHKRDCIFKVIGEMQADGVPIDGIGMQMHINIEYPTIAAIEEAIKAYAELGEVHITELDMSLYKNEYDSYDTVPDEVLLKQGYRYEELFEILKNHAEHIGSVTFWGMGDDHTWLKTFPTTRLNLPLLFDERLQAKYAYWGVVNPLQMPIKIKQIDTAKGTPVIDGEADILWQTQSWITFLETEAVTVSHQTRWDEDNLYLFINIQGNPEDIRKIDVFIDENNGKTESYEDDDQYYTFERETCSSCENISFAIVSDEESGSLEIAFPLSAETSTGDQVGFDVRVTLNSEPKAPFSWNDRSHSQDTNTSKFGALNFVDAPKVVAAIKGTPVIDAEEDDIWANANEIMTDVWVVGSDGSTGVARVMWDDENLYLYVVVTDRLLGKSSVNAYEQDSFEVFIDQNNAKTTTYQADDGQYRINFDNESSFNGGAKAELLTSATRITDDGYVVELAIRFDHIEPQAGMLIGFDIQVNNDENDNGIRDSVVTWNDDTHQSYQNTSGLGVLLFIE